MTGHEQKARTSSPARLSSSISVRNRIFMPLTWLQGIRGIFWRTQAGYVHEDADKGGMSTSSSHALGALQVVSGCKGASQALCLLSGVCLKGEGSMKMATRGAAPFLDMEQKFFQLGPRMFQWHDIGQAATLPQVQAACGFTCSTWAADVAHSIERLSAPAIA